MISARVPVEVLLGDGADAAREIEADFAMLEAAGAAVRVWTCARPAVVLGVSRDIAAEVYERECTSRGVAVLRRASGGGTVMIGPGTVQYAFVLPHGCGAKPPSLDGVKALCNDAVRRALAHCGVNATLESDRSGDLLVGDRKVGGLALRRHREATLLHGTLLAGADLGLISAVLRHPAREPLWRRGRAHEAFLASVERFSVDAFTRALADAWPPEGQSEHATPASSQNRDEAPDRK